MIERKIKEFIVSYLKKNKIENTDWSILFPCDFSSTSSKLKFNIPLSEDIKIL